jgi:hypothetical protein
MIVTLCSAGASDLGDEVSLMQFQNTVSPASDRVVFSTHDGVHSPEELSYDKLLSELDNEEMPEGENTNEREWRIALTGTSFEAFTLDEDKDTAIPAGCEDAGCVGSGPNCGGNSFDCTSQGLVVSGWHKSCSVADTCQTGWKVRCAKCPAGNAAVPAPMPAPSAGLAAIPEPAFPTLAPVPTKAPAVAPVLPTDAPTFPALQFDPQGVAYTKGNLTAGQKSLKTLKVAQNNATNLTQAIRANITLFAGQENKATKRAASHRVAAVNYARKVALANVTVMKATKAMASAYYAEKGASEGAKDALAKKYNYEQNAMYYQKLLIDQKQAVIDAQAAVRVGVAAINKARSDLAMAKKAADNNQQLLKKGVQRGVSRSLRDLKLAERASVKQAKEDAFVEASIGRNKSNTPPGGARAGVPP